MRSTRLPFVFILIFGLCHSSPDDNLPVYLRGIGWNKVEEYLKQDLRLSADVVPSNYAIELSVNIRGHAGAVKSDFNGTVTIYLDFKKPSDKIELHSNGLVAFLEHEILSIPAGVLSYSCDPERETITVHLNRTIYPHERFMLQINYRGVAKMDQYGLYENWNPKLNQSLDSFGPYVLATHNFPTGARFWFPCFDEPGKRATFELQITHPRDMNAYSNADAERLEINMSYERTRTVFEKTRLLSTYQVALSVNPYSSQNLDVEGIGKVRLIKSANSHDYYTSDPAALKWQTKDPHLPNIPDLLKSKMQLLGPISGMSAYKLDIILLEGAYSLSIQPGLITIGRRNFFRFFYSKVDSQELKQLAQVGFGYIAVRSGERWLRDMFSYSLPKDTQPWIKSFSLWNKNDLPDEEVFMSSLHERPLRDTLTYATTTNQYLASKDPQHAYKASHLLKLIERFCGTNRHDIYKRIISSNVDEVFDVDDFMEIASRDCPDPAAARMILRDFIDQPGKAFLTVKRTQSSATIEQVRYQNTFFLPELRDNKTRYTIPIFYTIDGQPGMKVLNKNDTSLTISVDASSLFLIDYHYEHLYLVHYVDTQIPPKNSTDLTMYNAILRSQVAAAGMGFVKYEQIQNEHVFYQEQGLFEIHYSDDVVIDYYADFFIEGCGYAPQYLDDMGIDTYENETCALVNDGLERTWDDTFNNETAYWYDVRDDRLRFGLHIMECTAEWRNSSSYARFLEDNFLGKSTRVRPERMDRLVVHTQVGAWRALHRFFFKHAANHTDHRFDILAEQVLMRSREPQPFAMNDYPHLRMRKDYLTELRDFVLRNPRRAASMSNEIAMKLEREFVREELAKWHGYKKRYLWLERFEKKRLNGTNVGSGSDTGDKLGDE